MSHVGDAHSRIPPELRRRLIERAREFRRDPTRSEGILWQALRRRKLDGRKFRRQHPIGPLIVDFYCAEERLVVEVDGPIHRGQHVADRERHQLIEAAGLRVVRIRSEELEKRIESAAKDSKGVSALTPGPAPSRGEG